MKKSEYARKYWFGRQQMIAGAEQYRRLMDETKANKWFRHAKYYFYNFLFQLAVIEFKINLYAGKFVVSVFNLINRHKLRVNHIVNLYAEKCRETTRA